MRDINSLNSNYVYAMHDKMKKLDEIDPVACYKEWLVNCPPPITDLDELKIIFEKIRIEDECFFDDSKKVVRNDFITRNLGLVLKVLIKYSGRGISDEDLIQEGNIGLIKAVDSYDPSRGYKFSTYACKCIENSMRNVVMRNNGIVSIPVEKKGIINKIFGVRVKLIYKLNRYPTDSELALELGMTVKEVQYYLVLSEHIMSLDAPVPVPCDDGSGDGTLYDFIADDKVDVYKENFSAEMQEKFNLTLNNILTDKEIYIIKTVYKFDGYNEETYEQIGEKLGVTRQRVQQMVEEVKTKLRRCNEIRNFAVYLDGDVKELDRTLIANRYTNCRKKVKK